MSRPVAIEVRDLEKSFRVPGRRNPATLAARLKNPTGRTPGRTLEVLRGLSFDVDQGEFFGVVGRNGSGKSTLLKILASVYQASGGRVRIAGRLAPFLELGVGFNPELPALDNVILNGVMMGLSRAEARRRFDEVVDFAGLEDYTDLQIKNYSSGMKVRLGFAVMTHVDADVLLIDEVLAVGDAEFQEKCGEVFERMHREGRTIILVTHSMQTVTTYCQRALLLLDGKIESIGEPDRVAERYYEVNLSALLQRPDHNLPEVAAHIVSAIANPFARITDAWLAAPDGARVEALSEAVPIEVRATIEIERDLTDGVFHFRILSRDGRPLFASDPVPLMGDEAVVRAGEKLDVVARVENRLPASRYLIAGDVSRSGGGQPIGPTKVARFEIAGEGGEGAVRLAHDVTVTPRPTVQVARR